MRTITAQLTLPNEKTPPSLPSLPPSSLSGFDVSKSGDTRIGLVGFPSVGKSTLLTTLTGTASEAAAYEFTTLTCIPGTMKYKGARIQVLDLPGIIEGAADGKGRGRQVISTARTCNMILIVLDSAKPVTHKKLIEQELFNFGIRINQDPPHVKFVTKDAGGVSYQEITLQTKGMNPEVARMVLKEYKVACAEVRKEWGGKEQEYKGTRVQRNKGTRE
jgi:small GTP-binding protein